MAALRSVGIVPPPDLHERVLGVAAWPVYEMMRDEFGLDLPFDDWIVAQIRALPAAGREPEAAPRRDRDLQRFAGTRASRRRWCPIRTGMIVDANLRAVGLAYPGMKTVSRNDVREGKPHPEPFLRAA